MAKIERKTQKIFAGQAGSQQITAFGTAKTENPIYTTDLAQIQNTNYLYGWASAILPDKAPYEEDTNALFYMITRQLAYLFQEGIAEYDANTEYSKNAFVRGVGSNIIYCSNQDNNIGHALNDINYWTVFNAGGSLAGYEIGLPQPTLSNTLLPNEIWLEGQAVSRIAYKKLFNIYGTTYGTGDGSTTFNLPDCRNRVFWGAADFGYINAGLPNITGCCGTTDTNGVQPSGCFYKKGISGRLENKGGQPDPNVYMDASLSSSIYGNSSTVQPPAIKARFKTRYY